MILFWGITMLPLTAPKLPESCFYLRRTLLYKLIYFIFVGKISTCLLDF